MLKSHFFKLFLAISLFYYCFIQPAFSFQTGKETVEFLVNTFLIWNGEQNQDKLRMETANYIAYRQMAQESIGSLNWDKLSNAQKYQYTQLFEKLIEKKFYPRWHKLFNRGKITINNEIKVDDEIYVRSILQENDDSDEVTWKFKKIDGNLKLVSLALNKKDLMNKISHRLKKKYDKLGYDKYIKSFTKFEEDSE